MKFYRLFLLLLILFSFSKSGASQDLNQYNLVWDSQSKNSAESMPLGGGDIGLNVWVENNDLLFYISKSGTFDENNTMLKLGRVRLKLSPNPFINQSFKQELDLQNGNINITAGNHTKINLWVDVFNPVIHVEIDSKTPVLAEAHFENWRYKDRIPRGKENNANSWKWAPQGDIRTYQDSVRFYNNQVLFYHHNREKTVFDAAVDQQGLSEVKDKLTNPIKHLIFGGVLSSSSMSPTGNNTGKYLDTDFKAWQLKSNTALRKQNLKIYLHTAQTPDYQKWQQGLQKVIAKAKATEKTAKQHTQKWWNNYWKRSYIQINATKESKDWEIARNYQLFRYMLGCNAYGANPTKFNGGLFTYDPSLVDSTQKFTPDFRNWGGGTHTAQNQRLVYWPMLRSGDFDMMQSQFNFYLNALNNAELRSQHYWNHKGASFTEQLENFGLPNPTEYGWKRPADYDKGMEYNAWLEHQWDTVLEICMMMLEQHRYQNKDISAHLPFIESCLTFFEEHYTYLAKKRGRKVLDENGHLVFYPGSATETYKMAYNANSTLSALKVVLQTLLDLPESYQSKLQKERWQAFLGKIPPLSFRTIDGKPMLSPAKLWERVNNTETPQLYPVYPWGLYGLTKSGLDTAINTYKYDPDALKFRSHVGWKQDNIFAARLGLRDDAYSLTTKKLENSGRRFPAFWGPGFDWVPDHNWGGSGMIGLQEMLLQTDDKKILLFPAWPKDKDVSFKLHAPYQTTVEAVLKNGKIETLKVIPEHRKKDIINLIDN